MCSSSVLVLLSWRLWKRCRGRLSLNSPHCVKADPPKGPQCTHPLPKSFTSQEYWLVTREETWSGPPAPRQTVTNPHLPISSAKGPAMSLTLLTPLRCLHQLLSLWGWHVGLNLRHPECCSSTSVSPVCMWEIHSNFLFFFFLVHLSFIIGLSSKNSKE